MVKIAHMPLNQRIYRQLRDLVVAGTLPPGARLDEQALADEMGVSRTPLREAIGQLVKEGLVAYRPYQGNFVRSFNAKEISDLYAVRKALEETAIRLATARLTEDRLARLRAILDDLDRALERDDLVAYGAADRQFHEAIARFSENVTLVECLDRLGLQVQLIRTIANRNPAVVARTALQRPQILAALAARDAERAAALMGEHIEGVRRAVVADVEAAMAATAEDRG